MKAQGNFPAEDVLCRTAWSPAATPHPGQPAPGSDPSGLARPFPKCPSPGGSWLPSAAACIGGAGVFRLPFLSAMAAGGRAHARAGRVVRQERRCCWRRRVLFPCVCRRGGSGSVCRHCPRCPLARRVGCGRFMRRSAARCRPAARRRSRTRVRGGRAGVVVIVAGADSAWRRRYRQHQRWQRRHRRRRGLAEPRSVGPARLGHGCAVGLLHIGFIHASILLGLRGLRGEAFSLL